MILISLMLTATTCLSSGCQQISSGYVLENVKENATTIVQDAIQNYDYTNFNLSFNDQESLTKQMLYKFAYDNDMLSFEEETALQKSIEESDDYRYFPNLENLYLRNDNLLNNNELVLEESTLDFSNNYTVGTNSAVLKPIEMGGEIEELFPLYSCDESKINVQVNGTLNDFQFLGLYFSKDTCVAFYNNISSFFNLMIKGKAQGSNAASSIFNLLKGLLIGTATVKLIEDTIGSVMLYFTGLYEEIMSLFTTGGPLGIAIGLMVVIVSVAVITLLTTIYVYGLLQKGFYFGFKRYGFLDWRFEKGELTC